MSEWIKHDGGPCPVPPEALVERDYGEYHGYGPANGATWGEVLRYRFLAPVTAMPDDEAFICDTAAQIMAAMAAKDMSGSYTPHMLAEMSVDLAEALATKLKERKA